MSRINKLANITGNGPQCPSETTWSLPIMMLRNWKSVFFFFFKKAIKKVMRGFKNRCGGARETNQYFLWPYKVFFVYCTKALSISQPSLNMATCLITLLDNLTLIHLLLYFFKFHISIFIKICTQVRLFVLSEAK